MNLAKQEGSERLARLAQIIPRGVIPTGLQPVERKLASLRANRPSREGELVVVIFEADLDRVFALDPRQIVRKLPSIIGEEPKIAPAVVTDGVVRNVSSEVDFGRTACLIYNAAMV